MMGLLVIPSCLAVWNGADGSIKASVSLDPHCLSFSRITLSTLSQKKMKKCKAGDAAASAQCMSQHDATNQEGCYCHRKAPGCH